jgi:GxxExxY protein
MKYPEIDPKLNKVAKAIVDAAYKVHFNLGPGLLEQVYEVCLIKELVKKKLNVGSQVPVPIYYDGEDLKLGFRLDLLVEDSVIVELKAVDSILPIHVSQLLTYLKLSKKRLGLLINFNVPVIKNGIKRIVL